MFRYVLAIGSVVSLGLFFGAGPATAAATPSGEVIVGQSVIEPGYNDVTGATTYVKTPLHAPEHANPVATAPFYVPVYPTSVNVGTLQCAHLPQDNCPDHGPLLAALAQQVMPQVYGVGVAGHDHLFATPGSGGDFNIAWVPVVVLFTSTAAASHHLTTLAQLNAAVSSGNAIEIPLPPATFHCEVVPENLYAMGTPVTPA